MGGLTLTRIALPLDNTAAARIGVLAREGLITRDLVDILHALRKIRNKAVHENYASVDDGKTLLQMAHSLCEWFMQTYGDWSYEHQAFVMPVEEPKEVVEDKAAEQAKEEALLQEAEQAAASAPTVAIQARRDQALKAASQRQKSEAETRYIIDEQLRQVGWEADTEEIRYSKGSRPVKGHNMAIAEWPVVKASGNIGHVDYALFIGLRLIAVVEAKAAHKDIPSVIDYQGKEYACGIRSEDAAYMVGAWNEYKVPFVFATNGRPYLEQLKTKSGIWFLDLRNCSNIPKPLHGWYSPEGLGKLLSMNIEEKNRQLEATPYDILRDQDGLNLRAYQIKAIEAAEKAILSGAKNVLLAMATGTGKTRTVLGMVYRFLSTNRFHRILFLVDRTSLGDQALDVFKDVKLKELMTLNDMYDIKGLDDKAFDPETRIHVATVQGLMRRVLYSEEGEQIPGVSDYDLIIVDEAHRGYTLDRMMGDDELLYRDQIDYQGKYRAVIEYFDAVKIALTATPALQTTEIFGEPVFQYTYREAVIEGYLVDHDAPHQLKTKLSTEGIHYKQGDTVAVYDPDTNEITNGALIQDELDFDIEQFNRRIVVPDFNRAVLSEIAKDIDPEGEGKTLIFAVNDAHADMIVDILRSIYEDTGVDQDAIMKITGKAGNGNPEKVREAIKLFKNERMPNIAVTVDLLTTGIDVPKITTLVFMRRVKSRILFEQMMGRATRLCPDIHKTHFEIYDPVGTYDSLEPVSAMKPVVANPQTSFNQLLNGLSVLEDDGKIRNQVAQIVAKIQRRKSRMNAQDLEQFKSMSGGKLPDEYIKDLQALPPQEQKAQVLAHAELFTYLDRTVFSRGKHIVISDAEDEVISHTRGYGDDAQRPEDYLDDFAEYVKNNRTQIAALEIVCTRPKELTRQTLKDLRLALDREGFTTQQLNTAISQMTNEEIAADIISLIRRYAIGSALISHEVRIRKAVEKLRKAHAFSRQELNWISRMEKYLMEESVMNVSVFDEDSRFKANGGFAKINKVFGGNLAGVITELNEYLYDDGGRPA